MTRQTMDGQEPIEERPIEPAQPVVENGECEEIGLLDPPAVDPSADSGGRKIGGIEIIDGRELMRRAGKRREDEIWLVDDWLPERSLFLMAGESHAGKSMVLLELAVSVASGRPFLGQHRVNQGPVLIVAAEDDPELVGERLDLAWRGKLESIPFPAQPNDGAFYYTAPVEPVGAPIWVAPGRAVGFGDPASEDTFAKVVGQLRPRLVIIDSLKDVVSGKITSGFYATLVPRLDVLKKLAREVGCSIGFAHHVGKNEERQGTDAAISGTNTFIGSFPTRWVVKRLPANGSIRAMSVTRSIKRAAPLPTVLLRYTIEHCRLCFDAQDADEEKIAALESQNEKDQAILAVLREHDSIGVNELHRALKQRNVTMAKDTLLRRLGRLQKSLHAARGADGKWRIGMEDGEVLDPPTRVSAAAQTHTRPTTTRKRKKS